MMRIIKKIKSGSLFPCCCFKRKTRPPENMPATPLEPKPAPVEKKDSDLLSSSSALSSEGNIIHEFTLEELGVMTQSFSGENFIGEGEFGPVHKGFIHDQLRPGLTAQPVVIKVLDFYPTRDYQEWLREVKYLGQLRYPNLVKLIGYCCEKEHKLLVYEYISGDSLDDHLFTRNSVSLNHHLPWSTRMRIAVGAARGVAFLHQQAQRPVLFGQFIKPSNILLDSDYNVKLSDFGFVNNDLEVQHAFHVKSPLVGYTPPEYIQTGCLTLTSDVYSFGVVLLELLTGRRAIDKSLQVPRLTIRACPHLNDPRKLRHIIDPRLEGIYSEKGSRVVASLASSCLSHMPKSRPTMSKVVATLESLKDYKDT